MCGGGWCDGEDVTCYDSCFCVWILLCLCWHRGLQKVLIHNCLSIFTVLLDNNKTRNASVNIEKCVAVALPDIPSSNGVAYV